MGYSGTLLLRDGSGEVQHFPIEGFRHGLARLDGLPSGSYDGPLEWNPISLSTDSPGSAWTHVTIPPNASVNLDVDRPSWGSLVVQVFDPRGDPYWGSLRVLIGVVQEEYVPGGVYTLQGDTIGFKHGPYVVPVLRSGRYTVQVLGSVPWIAERQDVGVVAHEPSTCKVQFKVASYSVRDALSRTSLGVGTPPK